jgi:hypothetical protein
MNVYSKLKDTINDLVILKSQPNLPNEIINISLKNIPYPDDLKTKLFANPELSLKILNRYNDITKIYIDDDNTLDNLLQFLSNRLIKKQEIELANSKKVEFTIYLFFDGIYTINIVHQKRSEDASVEGKNKFFASLKIQA